MPTFYRHRGFQISRCHTKRTLYTKKKPPVKRGQIIRLYIKDISKKGDGVGSYDNFAVFVPGAQEGDRVMVKIIEVKKNCAVGKKVDPHELSEK
ncbi:MAG: TRAM domain-containing protein [Candidatus Aenigmarchaeota archaeon]|nr:TRAM domain-containing protein [Candidatus Aenigmarchaeota archaeon]